MISEDNPSSIATSPIEESFIRDIDELVSSNCSTPKASATRGSASAMSSQAFPIGASLSTSSDSGSSLSAREDSSWHYNFEVPWNKMPSSTRKVLDTERRPSAAERREIIRIVVAEITAVCKKPGKRHITEIARKMVICCLKSFRDEIEGQVVGTGYDTC